jgi:Flp pilus assembly pilin Flp
MDRRGTGDESPVEVTNEGEVTMSDIMARIRSDVGNERGGEMVEWVIVVAILAVVAIAVLGPNGVLSNALSGGLVHIANTINAL